MAGILVSFHLISRQGKVRKRGSGDVDGMWMSAPRSTYVSAKPTTSFLDHARAPLLKSGNRVLCRLALCRLVPVRV